MIELDGAQHFEAAYQIRDAERDNQLANIGLKVLRFDDRQALMEAGAVLEVIYAEVVRRLEGNSNPP